MATVNYIFVFLNDAEGMVDGGVVPKLTFSWTGSDGSPASGCVIFTADSIAPIIGTETAIQSAGGHTWLDWGVPAGATVTAVRLVAFNYRSTTPGPLLQLDVDIVDAAGVSILSGQLRDASLTLGSVAPWTAGSVSGTTQTVNAPSQAAGTGVRFKLAFSQNNSGGVDMVTFFDTFNIAITYTPASDPTGNTLADIVRHSPHYSDSANAQRSIVRHG